MPMRQDCKQFESRTYSDGETVRKCNLDLAPEAPWRCPENCSKFEPRLADVNWSHGTLVTPSTPEEPQGEGIAELLDSAEDIINEVGPQVLFVQIAVRRDGEAIIPDVRGPQDQFFRHGVNLAQGFSIEVRTFQQTSGDPHFFDFGMSPECAHQVVEVNVLPGGVRIESERLVALVFPVNVQVEEEQLSWLAGGVRG